MNPITIFKERRPRPEKVEPTKNPWLLQPVENGLRATNVREMQDYCRPEKRIPVKYFEYDRLFGEGAFRSDGALHVTKMFGELKEITPKTIGFIFGKHHYLYATNGILRKHHDTGDEAFFSDETLRNQSTICYLNIDYVKEESTILETIQNSINELDDATTKTDSTGERILPESTE